jgi:hypothetical protein
VVAMAEPQAARLLGKQVQPGAHGVTCVYFAAERSPLGAYPGVKWRATRAGEQSGGDE